jgi:hypothetical protein
MLPRKRGQSLTVAKDGCESEGLAASFTIRANF